MKNTENYLILLGGVLNKTKRLMCQIAGYQVIAADSGIEHAEKLGVEPELWVGDFDSTSNALSEAYAHVPRLEYDVSKDATDGELAINEALKRGAKQIILAGALGGSRSDHALMHFGLCAMLSQRDINVTLTSGEEEVWPLTKKELQLELPAGSLFSILNFTPLKGLSISGALYPLDNVDLPLGTTQTLSNVSQGLVKINLQKGTAFLLARPYDFSGK